MVATWPSMQISEAWKTECQYPRLAGSLAKVSISPKLWLLRLTVTEGQDTLMAPTSRCVMPYASIQLATSDVLLMYGQPAPPVTHYLWPILARAMRRGQQPWHASSRCTWCVPSRRCTVGEGYHTDQWGLLHIISPGACPLWRYSTCHKSTHKVGW
jgi:hypothetical protein